MHLPQGQRLLFRHLFWSESQEPPHRHSRQNFDRTVKMMLPPRVREPREPQQQREPRESRQPQPPQQESQQQRRQQGVRTETQCRLISSTETLALTLRLCLSRQPNSESRVRDQEVAGSCSLQANPTQRNHFEILPWRLPMTAHLWWLRSVRSPPSMTQQARLAWRGIHSSLQIVQCNRRR